MTLSGRDRQGALVMRYQDGKVKDIKIAYIGGGSRGWAWRLMADLAIEEQLSGKMILYDIDRVAAEKNAIIGNNITNKPQCRGIWKYETADTLEEALLNADFVIISILPGTFDEMEYDVHTPEEFGILQSVGDTVGPGGIVRALRTLPMYVPIAESIKKNCPDAWVINFTNPMSMCVKVLYHIFPQIKAFGCCHEVFGAQKMLCRIVEETFGIERVGRTDIHTNVIGINHFTWLESASYKGINLFPVYKNYIQEHPKKLPVDVSIPRKQRPLADRNRVKFDLFERYGWIAAAGDRHLVEFMPGNEYLLNRDTIRDNYFQLTPVSARKRELVKRLERSEKLVRGEEAVELKASGEEGVRLIKALCGLTRCISNVNLPNVGQISNVAFGAVVETNAVFSRDKIVPVCAGSLKREINNLMKPHIANQEAILQAAMKCDFEAAVHAMCNDPNTKAKCKEEQIRKMLSEMLTGTKAYLPERWFI